MSQADVPSTAYGQTSPGSLPIGEGDQIERRVERAVFETDHQIVVGDVTLPPAGYQSRFSDSLNRSDLEFVPLTNVEISSLGEDRTVRRDFVVLSKRHIRVAYLFEAE